MAAKYVRTMAFREQDSVRPEIRASDPELSLDQWIGELQESIDTFDTPGFAKAVQVAFCGGLGSPLYDEVKKASEVRQGNDISFLAAILEIPGVARFPNRIIRKEILSDLRETSKYATH